MSPIYMMLLLLPLSVMARAKQPNIILILMDDLGYSDVEYLGGDIPTPIINRLATSGIRLNYHYAENICSATRSALLTGRYAWKTNLNEVIGPPSKYGINTSFDLISDVLSDNGYDTLFVGKWHIGSAYDTQLPYLRGFKQSLYISQGQGDYIEHDFCLPWLLATFDGIISGQVSNTTVPLLNEKLPQGFCGYDMWYNNHQSFIPFDSNRYSEDLYADKIKDYLRQYQSHHGHHGHHHHHKKSKKKNPFFIYWAMQTPHTPLTIPSETSTECDDLIGEARQIQCNMMYYADLLIGRIIDELKDKQLYDDTIIIFVSDNGAQPAWPIPNIGASAGQPLPFRGAKSNVFEAGIRTPAFINGGYLDKLYSDHHQCNYNDLVYVADLYAIIAYLAGIDDIDDDIDGINIWPHIEKQCNFKYKYKEYEDDEDDEDDENMKRDEIISFKISDNNEFYRAYVRMNEYKLLVNPNIFGHALFQFDFLQNWVNYDAVYYLTPNETYYKLYNDYDKNHYNQKLFYSKCYENYLNDPSVNNINTEPYLMDDNKIYLFKIKEDNIEACNIASEHIDIVNELMDVLEAEISLYRGSMIQGDKGGYVAMRDSYDCDEETFYFTTWADSPLYQNITDDWDTILLSIIDKVEGCPK